MHQIGLAKSNYWWFGSDGVLLLPKNHTVRSFNALKPIDSFRSLFDYANWGFALIGEVIERLSGMSYGDYLREHIFEPLGLERTTTTHDFASLDNFAHPYAALDDGSSWLLPAPAVRDGTIMVAAQGVRSSVNDLLRFSSALMQAGRGEPSALKNAQKQLSGHVFRTPFMDKSYGLGVMRILLPGTIGGGCNAQFGKLPIITSGNEARLVFSHGGSQAGYTTFLTMLLELDISFTVLTNSVGLADPSGWVNALLVETLVDSPHRNNFVALATDAARTHVSSYQNMQKKLDQERVQDIAPKPLDHYVGRYVDEEQDFVVEIKRDEEGLQVLFQGLESQLWNLRHCHYDTFLWFTTRDEHAKRAKFTYSSASVFKIIFSTDQEGSVDGLYWPHDPSLPEKDQLFKRARPAMLTSPTLGVAF